MCKLVSGDFAFNFYHNIWESMFNLIKFIVMQKLKDLFAEILWFLGEYWKVVLAAVLLIALIALIIFAHTPSVGILLIMAVNAIVFTMVALVDETQVSHLVNIISLISVWLLSALGADVVWSIIPIIVMGINAAVQGLSSVVVLMYLVMNLMVFCGMHEYTGRNQAKMPENRIEAVITEIEKRDHNDIMVVLDTKDGLRILPFSSSVNDAWRLEKGDTISVSIYNNAIIAFDR